ncbi:MAG: Gfo/Idh/MocA family oxidoreductase, partial [Candidatus Altiarchaeota archaeon]
MKAGLIGCGVIGSYIAMAFDKGVIDGTLTAIYDVDRGKAEKLASTLKRRPDVAEDFNHLLEGVDFVIEAASQEAVRHYMVGALEKGRDVLIMSVGALLDDGVYESVIEAARQKHARVYVPSGAIGGIDAITSASIAGIREVTLTTTKP